jgi:uncharacterized membrane-anchored protein
MKTVRLAIFIVVALAQISVPASMIWKRHHTLTTGRVWKFRTAPVDPVDAVRGRYLSLSYSAESFPRAEPLPYAGRTIYVALKEDADGFAVVDEVGNEPRGGDNVVQAESYGYYDGQMRVRFPFDRLWVSEADAPAAEAAYVANSRRENLNAYATVRVANGDAAIDELYIAGKPLREYLRDAR